MKSFKLATKLAKHKFLFEKIINDEKEYKIVLALELGLAKHNSLSEKIINPLTPKLHSDEKEPQALTEWPKDLGLTELGWLTSSKEKREEKASTIGLRYEELHSLALSQSDKIQKQIENLEEFVKKSPEEARFLEIDPTEYKMMVAREHELARQKK